jgi:RNA polymerase sigma-70 factor, ECF subfamily
MTDEELLTDASRGNEAAFLELYERHRDAVFRFAYRMLGRVEPAEDVAHDCFLSLIQNPTRFDATRASLRTYLFAAAHNMALNYFRSTSRDAPEEEMPECSSIKNADQPLTNLLDKEISIAVQQAISQLPQLQREALILFEYEECSLAEISRIVRADIGTVKARLYRARQALKKSLAVYFAVEPEAMVLEEAIR